MIGFVFIIEAKETRLFTVLGDNLHEAVRKVHAALLRDHPTEFSQNWEDLLEDIEMGNHTCYGPNTITSL